MAQKQSPTSPIPAADMPERVIAELDRHIAALEAAKEPLKAEDRAFFESGIEPIEPTAATIRLQERARAFMNGFAPEIAGLTAGEKCWMVRSDLRSIDAAIEAGQNAQRRAAIKLVAGALANHDARIRPILSRTLWLVGRLEAANRERAASCEAAMIEAHGMLDFRGVPWRAFDLLGLGDGTGESGQSGEAYEFAQLCEREGIKPKEIG